MVPEFQPVYVDVEFDRFLEAAWIAEDVRHGTDVGDADDSEGMHLSSQPPSPLTPLPTYSDLPNPNVGDIRLPPPLLDVKPLSLLIPTSPQSVAGGSDVDIEPLTLNSNKAGTSEPEPVA